MHHPALVPEMPESAIQQAVRAKNEALPQHDEGDDSSDLEETMGEGSGTLWCLVFCQVLASGAQAVAIFATIELYRAAVVDWMWEPALVSFAATAALSFLFGLLILTVRKGFLVPLYGLSEIGFFALFLFLFEQLVIEGRLKVSQWSSEHPLQFGLSISNLVYIYCGCVAGRSLLLLPQMLLMCFKLQSKH